MERTIWYVLFCESWCNIPTTRLSVEFYDTESEAKKHCNQNDFIGHLTLSSKSKIHVKEVDER